MKRDLELIRKIILTIEEAPTAWAPIELTEHIFEGYTQVQINYHVYLILNAGLAEGIISKEVNRNGPKGRITNLNWAGHEFAEAAHDETRWKKAMDLVKEKGGNITVGVLSQLLSSFMKITFGL